MRAADVPTPSRSRATLIGFLAVLLWSTLALATSFAGALPPFQLTALAFALAFALAAASWGVRGRSALAGLRQPWRVWALGIGGLFGYIFSISPPLGPRPSSRPASSPICGRS